MSVVQLYWVPDAMWLQGTAPQPQWLCFGHGPPPLCFETTGTSQPRPIQRSASLRIGSGTSIWIELGQWRAAVVWLLLGTAVLGVLQSLIFRGSGFQAALTEVRASGGTVDRRLERIEIWLGIVEDDPNNAPSES